MLSEAQDSVFGAVPHTLDIDVLCHIPDLLLCTDGISIVGMHDTCVVENDVDTAPGVLGINHSLDIGLLGDIALDCLDALGLGDGLLDETDGFFESGG